MKKDLLDKIRLRGYWRINFQPLVDIQKLKRLGECKEIIRENSVRLRGWDYPHFPLREAEDTGLDPAESWYVGWINWQNHKEFWHMYQSGQFLHYLALREDWLEEDDWRHTLAQEIKPMTSLGVTGTVIYQITEIFEFLSRLARNGLYDEGVLLTITLNNTQDRKLWIESGNRVPFFQTYKAGSPKIEFANKYTKDELFTKPKDLATEVILYFFDRFGWDDPSLDMIKKDQDDLLSGRR